MVQAITKPSLGTKLQSSLCVRACVRVTLDSDVGVEEKKDDKLNIMLFYLR